MSKTIKDCGHGCSPEGSLENVSGGDRFIRIIQALLAIYLLPALALVLLVGFAMLFVGAVSKAFLRVAWLLSSIVRGFVRRSEPLVSGAWVYRVGSRSLASHRTPHAQAAAQGGSIRRADPDVLN